jgi:hypothetical protein
LDPKALTIAATADDTAPYPRVAPPWPDRSFVEDWREAAHALGFDPFDWQDIAATYLMAADDDGKWLYPEIAVVVARQNGKTELLQPLIVDELDHGGRVLHTAQNRELPRDLFLRIGDYYVTERPDEVKNYRRANGQERLTLVNGGRYAIVAPQRGARGQSGISLLIFDEAREFEDFDVVAAALPTQRAVPNKRAIYLSNAGSDDSVVLNDLKQRSGVDPALCYLEWSAAPERARDDREGWREANPSPLVSMADLEREFISRTPAVFETEYLCRWVETMAPSLLAPAAWERLERPLEPPQAPSMGIALDVSGTRASAVLAWAQSDGTIAVTMAAEVTGEPIDLDAFGKALKQQVSKLKVSAVAYDPATDTDLSRYLPTVKALGPREFAQASERFVRSVEGERLRHYDARPVAGDLPYVARHASAAGIWQAVKARDETPITAALAAIRAVWLAAAPLPAKPRVY